LHFNCSSVQLSWRTPPAILNRERRAMLDRPAESFCFLPASRLFTIESTPQSRTFDGAFLSGSALSASLYPDPRRARYLLPSILLALCFHGLTNCFSRNPLVFITFCVAPGCHPPRYSCRSLCASLVTHLHHKLISYINLQTLFCSLLSFPQRLPLFSIACGLFCKIPGWW